MANVNIALKPPTYIDGLLERALDPVGGNLWWGFTTAGDRGAELALQDYRVYVDIYNCQTAELITRIEAPYAGVDSYVFDIAPYLRGLAVLALPDPEPGAQYLQPLNASGIYYLAYGEAYRPSVDADTVDYYEIGTTACRDFMPGSWPAQIDYALNASKWVPPSSGYLPTWFSDSSAKRLRRRDSFTSPLCAWLSPEEGGQTFRERRDFYGLTDQLIATSYGEEVFVPAPGLYVSDHSLQGIDFAFTDDLERVSEVKITLEASGVAVTTLLQGYEANDTGTIFGGNGGPTGGRVNDPTQAYAGSYYYQALSASDQQVTVEHTITLDANYTAEQVVISFARRITAEFNSYSVGGAGSTAAATGISYVDVPGGNGWIVTTATLTLTGTIGQTIVIELTGDTSAGISTVEIDEIRFGVIGALVFSDYSQPITYQLDRQIPSQRWYQLLWRGRCGAWEYLTLDGASRQQLRNELTQFDRAVRPATAEYTGGGSPYRRDVNPRPVYRSEGRLEMVLNTGLLDAATYGYIKGAMQSLELYTSIDTATLNASPLLATQLGVTAIEGRKWVALELLGERWELDPDDGLYNGELIVTIAADTLYDTL